MWITAVATIAIFVIGMASAESQHSSDRVDFYNTTVSSRVINGGQIQRNQLPWHVIVNIRRGRGYLAGGSLISSEFVLTEANSLRGADKFDCILGAHYSTDRKIVRQSTTAIIHPGHRQGNGNFNIALLKLDRAFTDFTRQIRPVLLPKALAFDDEFPYEGRHAWISGFGSTTGNQFITNQWSTVRILPNATCFETFPGVANNVLCTVGHDGYHSGPGLGDGGAPLVALEKGKYVQIGVYAFSWYMDFVRPVGYISTADPAIRAWIKLHTTI